MQRAVFFRVAPVAYTRAYFIPGSLAGWGGAEKSIRVHIHRNKKSLLTVAVVLHLAARLVGSGLVVHHAVEHLEFALQIGRLCVLGIFACAHAPMKRDGDGEKEQINAN
jgi:hypothetical protein